MLLHLIVPYNLQTGRLESLVSSYYITPHKEDAYSAK
jgi:hypothetical protein